MRATIRRLGTGPATAAPQAEETRPRWGRPGSPSRQGSADDVAAGEEDAGEGGGDGPVGEEGDGGGGVAGGGVAAGGQRVEELAGKPAVEAVHHRAENALERKGVGDADADGGTRRAQDDGEEGPEGAPAKDGETQVHAGVGQVGEAGTGEPGAGRDAFAGGGGEGDGGVHDHGEEDGAGGGAGQGEVLAGEEVQPAGFPDQQVP